MKVLTVCALLLAATCVSASLQPLAEQPWHQLASTFYPELAARLQDVQIGDGGSISVAEQAPSQACIDALTSVQSIANDFQNDPQCKMFTTGNFKLNPDNSTQLTMVCDSGCLFKALDILKKIIKIIAPCLAGADPFDISLPDPDSFKLYCVKDPRSGEFCSIRSARTFNDSVRIPENPAVNGSFCYGLAELGCCVGTISDSIKSLNNLTSDGIAREAYNRWQEALGNCSLSNVPSCPPVGDKVTFVTARWHIMGFDYATYLLKKASVELAFRKDIAASIKEHLPNGNITPDNVIITNVTSGSLVVDFQILGTDPNTVSTSLKAATAAPTLTNLQTETSQPLTVDTTESTVSTTTTASSPAARVAVAVPAILSVLIAAFLALWA